MKKILSIVLSTLMFLCCCISASAYEFDKGTTDMDYSSYSGKTLTVFNWGEYLSDGSDDMMDVNAEFEELTGIKVNYVNFETNEDMYAKIKGGGSNYDVIIPSDYMIARMAKEGMLEKLDYSKIPNYKYIDDSYKGLYYDVNNEYTVPYCVGKVGLIYNSKMVEGKPDSWSILWDEKYAGKILMINNSRDAFGVAHFLLGNSVNTEDAEKWNAAADKLKEQKQNSLLKGYVMDEVFNQMEQGSAAMVPYYAGDFLTMYANNPDLAFVYPKEGTNIFVDCACIPKGAENKEMAELYINFLADPAVAVENAIYTGYASPNKAVLEDEAYIEYLAEIHPDAQKILYGDPGVSVEYYHDLPEETKALMNQLWEDLKADGFDAGILIVVCVVVIVALAVFFIVRNQKRKKAMDDVD